MKKDKLVKEITPHPEYEIIKPYKVTCGRCSGRGQTYNHRTGNFNKCTLCKGHGKRTKRGAKYTADFHVTYIDGLETVFDVKGGRVSHDFPLRRKLFEIATGQELKIARLKKTGWEIK